MKTAKTVREIPVKEIERGENYREPKNIEQLAISVKSEGQLVPIHVTKKKDKYIILDGFRRFGAVEYANRELGANIETMSAFIVEENYNDNERALMQMILNESLQSPLEKAIKIAELIEHGMQQQRLADAFGVSKSYISGVNKRIVPDPVFKNFLNNETIYVLKTKEGRKYFESIKTCNEFIGTDIELTKKVAKISPDDVKINYSALEPIAEVFYKLKELDRIDYFREIIATFQKKNVKDSKTIEKYCRKVLNELGEKAEDNKTKSKTQDKLEIVKKISDIFAKFKTVDDDVVSELNRSFEERNLPFTITLKNK